jgi:Family of unknown function (DUF6807)
MMTLFQRTISFSMFLFAAASTSLAAAPDAPAVEFARGNDRVTVAIDGLPVMVYCYHDRTITRPFFAHVRAPSGVQVTRHHPPIEGQDSADHATFHPGIWMSFGDISGSDYWRIMARVRQKEFVDQPHGGSGTGTFAVRNEYLDQKDPSKVVCNEIARYTFLVRPAGYLLLWDSTFSSDKEFYFGDQEEMGLGFRVATPLRVEQKSKINLPPGNGTILDSQGRKNEKQIWGNSADWCDYSGTMAGELVGMTIFPHPDNLRPSWFHARDYGLLEANQFGRKAFGKGEISKVPVRPGEKLRLRYGVLIHSGPPNSHPDLAAAYQDYLRLAGK